MFALVQRAPRRDTKFIGTGTGYFGVRIVCWCATVHAGVGDRCELSLRRSNGEAQQDRLREEHCSRGVYACNNGSRRKKTC